MFPEVPVKKYYTVLLLESNCLNMHFQLKPSL